MFSFFCMQSLLMFFFSESMYSLPLYGTFRQSGDTLEYHLSSSYVLSTSLF